MQQQTKKKKRAADFVIICEQLYKEKLLQFVPPLTQPKIDAARKHASMKGPGQILNN